MCDLHHRGESIPTDGGFYDGKTGCIFRASGPPAYRSFCYVISSAWLSMAQNIGTYLIMSQALLARRQLPGAHLVTYVLRAAVQHDGAARRRRTSGWFNRDLKPVRVGDCDRHQERRMSDRIDLKHPGRQRLLASHRPQLVGLP